MLTETYQSQPSEGLGRGENIERVLEVEITSFEKYFVKAEILLWRTITMDAHMEIIADMSARGVQASK